MLHGEREEDFERVFEKLYVVTICIANKNKELKEQLEAMTKENDVLKGELRNEDKELSQSKAKVQELQQFHDNEERSINKLLGESDMLASLLLSQKSPCKMRLGGHNHDGETSLCKGFKLKNITKEEISSRRKANISSQTSRMVPAFYYS